MDGRRAILKGGQETESSVVERGHSTAVAWADSFFLGESDPEEQRLCGCVGLVTKGQEMQFFFSDGGKH